MQATRPVHHHVSGAATWQRSIGEQMSFMRSTVEIEAIEIDGLDVHILSGTVRSIDTPLGSSWEADLILPAIVALPRADRPFPVTFRTRPGLFTDARVLRGLGRVAERAAYAMRLESIGDDATWASD